MNLEFLEYKFLFNRTKESYIVNMHCFNIYLLINDSIITAFCVTRFFPHIFSRFLKSFMLAVALRQHVTTNIVTTLQELPTQGVIV